MACFRTIECDFWSITGANVASFILNFILVCSRAASWLCRCLLNIKSVKLSRKLCRSNLWTLELSDLTTLTQFSLKSSSSTSIVTVSPSYFISLFEFYSKFSQKEFGLDSNLAFSSELCSSFLSVTLIWIFYFYFFFCSSLYGDF